MHPTRTFGVLSLSLCVCVAACDNAAVNKDRTTTFLNSNDMETMTNQMAQSIIADPRIQAAAASGPLKIVIRPVENLTDEIIPGNECELFVARLQGLLASRPELANRFVWCVNRSDYAKLRAEEIPESKIGVSEDRVQPEYQLYAEFRSSTDVTTKSRSDTYLCHYKLTKISNGGEGLILWMGEYETSKAIKKGFLD
jgi:hypothetical protein